MIPLGDDRKLRRTPWMVWLIVGLCTGAFLCLQLMPAELRQEVIFRYGLVPARYRWPTWSHWVGLDPKDFLPFLTNLFLHAEAFHLLFNLWLLVIFGDDVEDVMGPWRFSLFFLLCGLFANLTHVRVHDLPFPAIGTSGALSGIFPLVHLARATADHRSAPRNRCTRPLDPALGA